MNLWQIAGLVILAVILLAGLIVWVAGRQAAKDARQEHDRRGNRRR